MTTMIIGANSAIATCAAYQFAKLGHSLVLVGRNETKLNQLKKYIIEQYKIQIDILLWNALSNESSQQLIQNAQLQFPECNYVLISHGELGIQNQMQNQFESTMHSMQINLISVIALLTPLAKWFEKRGYGTIAVISSVAGNRGRQSNYIYGSSKAGLDAFLSGLRNRLFQHGVHVMTIKPGFVDTPMTQGFKKGPLWASAESVSNSIVKGMIKKSNIVYTPFWWRGIMGVIDSIPEFIFKRLKL